MTRVFVTGATGVLGRRVAGLLVAAGHVVTAVARTEAKATAIRAAGATPASVDLFDVHSVRQALAGHDAVAQLATNIPTGASAMIRRGWRTNDALRRDASAILASAAIDMNVGRFIQESITFPYVDRGDVWIDENVDRTYFWGNQTTVDAEASAARVTNSGGFGVVLRFAMFMAPDSAHVQTFIAAARRGVFAIPGRADAYMSWIHVEDAAAAVVAALDAPSGIYNVAEADPERRSEHRLTLAAAVGRPTLHEIPQGASRLGGSAIEALSRSQRVSSHRLQDMTSWRPTRPAIKEWSELS